MFGLFKRQQQNKPETPVKRRPAKRSFIGARNTAFNRFQTTFATINQELKQDFIGLTLRARSLYKNSDIVNSYVNLMLRSVLGPKGFILNVTAYNEDGTSDIYANNTIENFWYEYQHSIKHYVDSSETCNGLDFDRQVLFSLLVDGECFIRKIKDPKSKFGIRFQIIDSLNIAPLYNCNYQQDGTRVVMGIKVDEHNKPLSYFIRENKNTDFYLTGERIEVPADQIIHIYRKLFPDQIRGFSPLAPVLLSLNSLDEYKRSEINSALLQSIWFGVYEKQSTDANAFDDYDESEIDNSGNVAYGLEQGTIKFAPDGYKLNQIAPNHPNNNFGLFVKNITKGICGALGISYNKVSSDVSETSYSSLRQANIQDALTVSELQEFFITNWKDIQFAEFLKYLLLSDLTNLPYSKIDKFSSHDFQGRNAEYLDPAKEMQAIQLRLALGLSSPIEEIHNAGKDPIDVLNSWQKWNAMLRDRGLQLSENINTIVDGSNNDNNENQENDK